MFTHDGLADEIAGLLAVVESLTEGPRAVGDDEVDLNNLRGLLVGFKKLEAAVGDRLLEAAERDLNTIDGWPQMASWAQSEMLMNRNDVNALMRAARTARLMPAVGGLWREGWFSTTHVALSAGAVDGMSEQVRVHADEFLAKEGRTDTIPDFAQTCQDLRETLVPDLVADELERLREASHVSLRPVAGGMRLSGVINGDLAERVKAGIDRFSRRTVDDDRDAALRRAEGLATALSFAARADVSARDLEGTPYEPSDVPSVRIQTIVDVRALQRAMDREADDLGGRYGDVTEHRMRRPDWFPRCKDDLVKGAVGERTRCPIDWRTLVMEFCHGDVQRLVLGPKSEVLDLGRRVRLFSAAQRQAMMRGRGRCQWRGCDSPWVEADHIHRFVDGGRTDVNDGRMLCEFHHRLRHQGWTLVRRSDGTYDPKPPPDWAQQRMRSMAAKLKRQPRVA